MTETIDHAELRGRIEALADKIEGLEKPDPMLLDALSVLDDAIAALHSYTLATGPADVGVNAKPSRMDPQPGDPVPDGPFLLIMQDENVSGGLWMRRFARKADAVAIECNYTGSTETWLFEVTRELDIDQEREAFWRAIRFSEDREAIK